MAVRGIGINFGLIFKNVNKKSDLFSFKSQSRLFSAAAASPPQYEFIKVEHAGTEKNVGIVTLNRPKALNALCNGLMNELAEAVKTMDDDPNISTIILTGNDRAFAAGADIKEMSSQKFAEVFGGNFLSGWDRITHSRKPIIAAVNGYALGGGCELAMMSDIIIAGENAKFGQPEIKLGTIPGAGGTQRLVKAIGKSKAMVMCLTGDMITAKEAEAWGLVASVHPPEKLIEAAIELAEKIGNHSKLINSMVKESINNGYEMTLREGLHAEKRLFHSTFATNDRKEGMDAFVAKRKPNFTDS